jgi:hypothetical protein
MRSCGDVPRVTGRGACTEAMLAIDKMGDVDFDGLQGRPGGRGERVVEFPAETPTEHILRILARIRHQPRLASSSIAVVDWMQSVNRGQAVNIRTT